MSNADNATIAAVGQDLDTLLLENASLAERVAENNDRRIATGIRTAEYILRRVKEILVAAIASIDAIRDEINGMPPASP